MQNNEIQFFTKDQAGTVSYHIRNLYSADRIKRRDDFLKSDEGKKLVKEINESEYAKELQADRETVLKDYDNITKLYTQLRSTLDKDSARSMLRVLRNPICHIKEDSIRWSNINISPLAIGHLEHMYSDKAYDAIMDNTNRKELDCDLGEWISRRIENRAKNRIEFEIDSYDNGQEVDAIVATIPACDLSQAVDKVVEKLPYETINAFTIEDEKCSEASAPIGELVKEISSN